MAASPRFALRIAPEVRQRWEEAADAEGLSLARWLHEAAEARIAATPEPTPPPPPVPEADCAHQRTKSTGYMVICESCGKRIR